MSQFATRAAFKEWAVGTTVALIDLCNCCFALIANTMCSRHFPGPVLSAPQVDGQAALYARNNWHVFAHYHPYPIFREADAKGLEHLQQGHVYSLMFSDFQQTIATHIYDPKVAYPKKIGLKLDLTALLTRGLKLVCDTRFLNISSYRRCFRK